MEKMLNKFIEKNIDKKGFHDYLINSYSPMLKNYYLKYDIKTYNEIVGEEEFQYSLHKFMEKECIDLFEFCNKNDINIIGLKGIFIEKQFWSTPRYYNDIDVIVDMNKIDKLYNYFSEKRTYKLVENRNYNPFKRQNTSLSKMLNVNLNKTNHIVLWNENEELLLNDLDHVEIEIHGCFDTFDIVNIDDKSMFNDCITFENFNVLNYESQILYLIYHTIHHLPYIRHNLTGLYVEINRFIDVALVILNSEINWDKFEKLCAIHTMSPLCSLYFKMFIEIFPNIMPDSVIRRVDLETQNVNFKWKKTYLRLMKMNALDLIIGNFNDFPEIEKPYLKIKKYILRERFNNKYILKLAMELWKIELSKIHANLE